MTMDDLPKVKIVGEEEGVHTLAKHKRKGRGKPRIPSTLDSLQDTTAGHRDSTADTRQHLRLKLKEYKAFQTSLGETGAGLTKEEHIPGSEIMNNINAFQQKFPWYDDLHAIWCENPSYNPIAIMNITMKSRAECVHDFQLLVSGGKGGDVSVGSGHSDEDLGGDDAQVHDDLLDQTDVTSNYTLDGLDGVNGDQEIAGLPDSYPVICHVCLISLRNSQETRNEANLTDDWQTMCCALFVPEIYHLEETWRNWSPI
ncbi:hypothetical protein BS47DRAFT_1441626 [Hydnum rufescens UP504]|uniref:Uncharacterized protein n=1 Tax=Hydnum rufescens UP504 TaxID=1448309 RepID=A0A9P6B248_9AGAM|nr:hypothetical protein BS47DRAFT_1441626 [Hydnum rufescens UP504]